MHVVSETLLCMEDVPSDETARADKQSLKELSWRLSTLPRALQRHLLLPSRTFQCEKTIYCSPLASSAWTSANALKTSLASSRPYQLQITCWWTRGVRRGEARAGSWHEEDERTRYKNVGPEGCLEVNWYGVVGDGEVKHEVWLRYVVAGDRAMVITYAVHLELPYLRRWVNWYNNVPSCCFWCT